MNFRTKNIIVHILFILGKCNVFAVPDIIGRMHFVRTGIISFVAMCIFAWWDGMLDEEDVPAEEGEELAEDDEFVDE